MSGTDVIQKELEEVRHDVKNLEGKVYTEHQKKIAELCTAKTMTEKRLSDLEKGCPYHGTLSKQLEKLTKQGQAASENRIRLQLWQEEVDKVVKEQAATLKAVNEYLSEQRKKEAQEQGAEQMLKGIYNSLKFLIPAGIAAGALILQLLQYLAALYHKSGGVA